LGSLAVGEVVEGEYRWVKSNGAICWLHSFQTSIALSEAGSAIQSLTIVQDVTEIKRAQEELQKSENNYRELVKNIPGIVYQAKCDEVFTTIFISDYFEKLTSIKKEEVLFNRVISWIDLVHPDDRNKLVKGIQKSIENITPFEIEYRLRKANGEYIYVVDAGRITFDENKNPLIINGVLSDISIRKRDYEAMRNLSQDNIRLLAQARRDSDTKTLLLNEVNHRVKNNIASIIGLLELEGKREIHSSTEFQNTLSDIKSRISGLATVHDILSSNQWAPVQMELFVRKIIENASSSSPIGRKVVLNIHSQERNLWINSRQATALALILSELTTNAIRHAFTISEKRVITVTIRKEDKTTNRIRISFADNGPGWPEEIIAGTGGNVGMQVIKLSAISPLNGEIKFENHEGAVAIISFNLAPQRELFKANQPENET
ncbi:MAG TPA: PAS domain-containing protein, partial [Leptolinea sp.]